MEDSLLFNSQRKLWKFISCSKSKLICPMLFVCPTEWQKCTLDQKLRKQRASFTCPQTALRQNLGRKQETQKMWEMATTETFFCFIELSMGHQLTIFRATHTQLPRVFCIRTIALFFRQTEDLYCKHWVIDFWALKRMCVGLWGCSMLGRGHGKGSLTAFLFSLFPGQAVIFLWKASIHYICWKSNGCLLGTQIVIVALFPLLCTPTTACIFCEKSNLTKGILDISFFDLLFQFGGLFGHTLCFRDSTSVFQCASTKNSALQNDGLKEILGCQFQSSLISLRLCFLNSALIWMGF